jgi:hypothetical protein
MATEVTLSKNEIEKINSTEKMTKATLIVVCVGVGIMSLYILIMLIHAVASPRNLQRGVKQQQSPGMRGRIMRPGIQPQSGTQPTPNTQGEPAQTQDSTDSVDINTL